MKPGDHFRFKEKYKNFLWGEGVVYEVLEGMGRRKNETHIRGLFNGEEYESGATIYEDGVLQYVEMDNAVTFGIDELELVE